MLMNNFCSLLFYGHEGMYNPVIYWKTDSTAPLFFLQIGEISAIKNI